MFFLNHFRFCCDPDHEFSLLRISPVWGLVTKTTTLTFHRSNLLIPLGRVTVISAFSIVPGLSMKGHLASVCTEGSSFTFVAQGIVTVLASWSRQMAVQAGIMPCQIIHQPRPIPKPCLVRLIPTGLIAELFR